MIHLWKDYGQPALVAGCLVLAGCSEDGAPSSSSGATYATPVGDPVFTADGIDVGQTGMEIDFGRAQPGAITAMSKLMGAEPSQIAAACTGLTAARWRDGTVLYFEQRPYDPGAFVGWSRADGQAGRTCGA